MHYAIDPLGLRIDAAPGRVGHCPLCGDRLVPRCGEVRIWHWAHEARPECDPWWEPETEWHRGWKELADPTCTEVPFQDHRADIVGPDGVVIELQRSTISPEQIRARERCYGRMVWVLCGEDFRGNFRVQIAPEHHEFTWAHPRSSWLAAKMPIFVDSFSVGRVVKAPYERFRQTYDRWHELAWSEELFQIRQLRQRPIMRGLGRIVTREQFLRKLIPEACRAD